MLKRKVTTKYIRNAKGQVIKVERSVTKKGLPWNKNYTPVLDKKVKEYNQKQRAAKRKRRAVKIKKARSVMNELHRRSNQAIKNVEDFKF